MARVLVLTTSSNNCAAFIGSLQCLGDERQLDILAYDRRWHEKAIELIQKNPSFQQQLQMGAHIRRDDCAMDEDMLRAAKLGKPDLIVYISAWKQDFVPLNETLGELNAIAPLVHFLSDGADPPWWPELREFERRQCFSLTVNIDGSHAWPGGKDWNWTGKWLTEQPQPIADFHVSKALTLLTPIDTRFYPAPKMAYGERPIAVGYAGNLGASTYGHRNQVVQRLNRIVGFQLRQRDNSPQSYPGYADFLAHCRVSVDVPFSGSGAAKQVKGRVVETGYAGAALLTWESPAMEAWFTPQHEYWSYSSIEEAHELAEWLAGHPKIAGESAAALHEKMIREHNPSVFWAKIFGGVK